MDDAADGVAAEGVAADGVAADGVAPDGVAAARGEVLVSLLSLNDAWSFAAEREERHLDEPLRSFADLLRR